MFRRKILVHLRKFLDKNPIGSCFGMSAFLQNKIEKFPDCIFLGFDTFNCISGGVCTPGSTQSCGFCGTRTCQSNSQWGTCQNQGICNPGTSQSCSGGTQTCQSNCQWGSCQGTCGDVQVSCGGTCTNNCASTLCDSNPCNGCTNQCVTCGGNPPDNYGQACNCNPNCPSNCGGTIQCDRSCSGPTPSCDGVPTSANGYVFRDANKNGQL